MSYMVCWLLTNCPNSVAEHASDSSFASATSVSWVCRVRSL
jgi:hypothetical protein